MQVNSGSVGIADLATAGESPDFKVSASAVGINDNAPFVGTGELSEDIAKDDVLIIQYQAKIPG